MLYHKHFLPLFSARGEVARVSVLVMEDGQTRVTVFPRRWNSPPVLIVDCNGQEDDERAEVVRLCPPSYRKEVGRMLKVIARDVGHVCRETRLWRTG